MTTLGGARLNSKGMILVRRSVLLLVLIAMVLAVAVPAAAAAWTERVFVDAVSHTSGSGTFYMSGVVVGSDADANGTIEYYHPHQPGRVNPYEARLRLVDLECLVVESSVKHPGDHNVLAIGRLLVLQDDGEKYGDYAWGAFIYYPDDPQYYRPYAFRGYEEKPSCDDFPWHGSGYRDNDGVTVISR